ncbi:MAG: hypothetical protein M1828_005058 [Chrysothrix sp. TS-e1954]|nr:MAG: hypothetical protein M1828_005058 [Chrysothrix sp. TS-e1954]
MCRWFAYVSEDEPALLEDILITPINSLSRQISEHYLPKLLPHDHDNLGSSTDKMLKARNSILNMDGCGVAWYSHATEHFVPDTEGSRPAFYKSISPPIHDLNFRHICANTESKAVFAHVRAATSIVQQTNCHPFAFGRHIFMHNGVVANFTDIRRELCDLLDPDVYANVLGSTDSEHLGGLYVTYLTQKAGGGAASWEKTYSETEMAAALEKAVITVLQLQQKIIGAKMGPSSLNLCATDGRRLVTMRFRNHATEQPPSLYYSTVAGTTLNRKYPGHPNKGEKNRHQHKGYSEHGSHVIVASEPTTYDEKEWSLIDANSIVMVDVKGKVGKRKVTYDDGLNAIDPDA